MSRLLQVAMPDDVAEAIAHRFRAGDTIGLLAWDYNRTHLEIEAAIRRFMLAIGERKAAGKRGGK